MAKPLIIINFKAYEQATGENAVKLAKECQAAAKKAKGKARIPIAVQTSDIYRVGASIDRNILEIFAQHIDSAGQGKFTGYNTAEAAREAGAIGTLLNHAEHKITDIAKRITIAKNAGLKTVVCAANLAEAKMIASLTPAPDYIAVEPPELIGGKISVSKANPELIEAAVAAVKQANSKIIVLCGAGVNSKEDVRKALELGTEGVLLASSVVLANDPEEALAGLLR